jgi:hypothetical protein
MGLRSSPYQSVQGQALNVGGPHQAGSVLLEYVDSNQLGDPDYRLEDPWIWKLRCDKRIAADIGIRETAPTAEMAGQQPDGENFFLARSPGCPGAASLGGIDVLASKTEVTRLVSQGTVGQVSPVNPMGERL